MSVAQRTWVLEEAVVFLHALQEHFHQHHVPYYAGLTGSVLYGKKRSSTKDLDIILYPRSSKQPSEDQVKAALRSFGLRLLYGRDIVTGKWRRDGSDDEKHIEVWALGNKRVDIFFLS